MSFQRPVNNLKWGRKEISGHSLNPTQISARGFGPTTLLLHSSPTAHDGITQSTACSYFTVTDCSKLQKLKAADIKKTYWYYSIFFILLTNPIKRPKQDYHPSPLVPTLDTNFHKYKRVLQPKRPAGVFPKLAEWLPNIYKGWKLPATGLPDLRRRGNNNRPLVNVKNRSQFG